MNLLQVAPQLPIRYLIIITAPAGLKIMDTPRPQSQGAIVRRAEGKGSQLYAYKIINFAGVDYAMLVPRDPNKPDWMRMGEADRPRLYAEETDLLGGDVDDDPIARALNNIADAIRSKK